MEYLYKDLMKEYYIIVPEYNGHYENSTFTTRQNEAKEIVKYIEEQQINSIAIVYGQSMG